MPPATLLFLCLPEFCVPLSQRQPTAGVSVYMCVRVRTHASVCVCVFICSVAEREMSHVGPQDLWTLFLRQSTFQMPGVLT